MTNKLKNAFDKISTLSEKEQDAIAEALLAVVDDTWGPEDEKDEAEWDALVGSKRSHAWLDKMVKQVRQDIQEGKVYDFDPSDSKNTSIRHVTASSA